MTSQFVDAVGFDLDDTLYTQTPAIRQTIHAHIMARVSADLHISLQETEQTYQRLYPAYQSARRTLEALGISEPQQLVQDALEHADIAGSLQTDDRLVSLLRNLQTSYRLFLITGSEQQASHRKLDALGIPLHFFSVCLYAGAEHRRHDGTAFIYVAQKLGLPLHRMLFVGDREKVDILPAKQLGVKTAIVNAQSEHADYQLETIYDLEKILLP